MGTVIDFRDGAMASLRARVAEVEEANRDLVAFARGHSGAVTAIHAAVVAAIEADGLDHLVHIATQDWPDLLGVDAVALALVAADTGLAADADGLHLVDRRVVERMAAGLRPVMLHPVERGHPLFGPAAPLIRAEAVVRLDTPAPLGGGLLLLGQRAPTRFETAHGAELLVFLGSVLSRGLARWLVA